MGKTSRGIFIKSSSRWLVFVSIEPFHSPLTINIGKNDSFLERVRRDELIQISDQQLVFPESHLVISTDHSEVWRTPFTSIKPLPEKERYERLKLTAIEVMNTTQGDGLMGLIPKLLNSPELENHITRKLSPFEESIQNISTRPFSDSSYLVEFLGRFIGKGGGLTPSGDDFVIGFLLALERWKDLLFSGHDIDELNHAVVDAAYKKTTTLSANLIECASHGQGDERLIAAIDWLMSGKSPKSSSIRELLGWGSSSGGDVFAGFVAALTLDPDRNQT